ncbi:MAG: NEW3 domain-containing protein [Thermoguttaceae bacterium]
MSFWLSLLIVAASPTAPMEGRYPEASEVFHCAFSEKWDQNYDNWPDNWTRRRGPRYPRYIPIEMIAEATPAGKHCLRIELDGAGAVAYSPPIPISSLYEYVLEGLVRTQGLEHDRAWLSLTFLDADQEELDHHPSVKVRDTLGWQKLRLGPVAAKGDRARFVLIGLHLEPGARADLKGSARFDDLWLGRLPRIALTTGSELQLFTAKEVPLTCHASGFTGHDVAVKCFLEDVHGTILATQEQRLEVGVAEIGAPSVSKAASPSEESPPLVGTAHWQPPIPGPGFYRIYATMPGRQSPYHRPSLALVVLTPQRPSEGSQFGWTLPNGDAALPLPILTELISQAGIGWVKYPVWYDEASFPAKIAKLIPFIESLGSQGIEMAGLLIPPDALRQPAERRRPLSVAEVFFQEPKVWYPTVELTLARLAVQVRWWQLGDDRETSFVDTPNLAEKILRVKKELDRLGNDVNVGFGWRWSQTLPQGPEGKSPWRFVSLSAQPPLKPDKLGEMLDGTQKTPLRRWVVLDPLPRGQLTLDARVDDLVRQMMTAKIHGAECVFVADPFHEENGLMNPDGTPGELFLPWRTAALALGGTSFVKSVTLPNDSPNQVFIRPKDAVMIVWNDKPQREVLYLGQNVQQLDPWGRRVTQAKDDEGQVLEVGPVPTFVFGLNPSVVRWRQEVSFTKLQLPSILGVRHDEALRMKNPLDHPVSGSFRLLTPQGWRVEPQTVPFQLESGKSLEQPFTITLADDTVYGPQKVRVEYALHTDPPVRFCVYRTIEIGLGDVKIEVSTQLDEQGSLDVEQRFINTTDQTVNFRCHLYSPERRRQTTQIAGLGRGEDRKTYHLTDGRSLLGKTLWLRAEEIGGPRILNHRFVVKE